MKKDIAKTVAAFAGMVVLMIPAGAALASPAGRPAQDAQAAVHGAQANGNGHSSSSNNGNANGNAKGSDSNNNSNTTGGPKSDPGKAGNASSNGNGAVEIGDALRIIRTPDGGAQADPSFSEAQAASASTATSCPNSSHNSNTGHGANTSGAYDSTCDGSPSMNGNGNGKATGKPCAGCVGNADDKNPPGQAPNGSDHNKGYECDANHGVGKGNPAHSACSSSPTPPGPTPTPDPKPKPKPDPKPHPDPKPVPKECASGATMTDVNHDGVINEADCVPPTTPSTPGTPVTPGTPTAVDVPVIAASSATPAIVLGETVTRAPATPVAVSPAVAERAPTGVKVLAFTGSNAIVIAMIGLLLLVMGAVVRRLGRRASA